jgi:hypothetical protein
MTAGIGLTSTEAVLKQPVFSVYVIIAVPCDTPVITPEEVPAVATAVLLLDQVPPGDVSPSVIVDATQTVVAPVMALGSGFTVKVSVLAQPVGTV